MSDDKLSTEARTPPQTNAIQNAIGVIAFLRCCIRSGESLNEDDEKTVSDAIAALRVPARVGHFEICKAMAIANADIRLSTMDNITDLAYQKKTRGTKITIGVDGDLVAAIGLERKYIGGLMLINREEYFATKARLEAEQGGPDGTTPQADKEL